MSMSVILSAVVVYAVICHLWLIDNHSCIRSDYILFGCIVTREQILKIQILFSEQYLFYLVCFF